MSTQPALIKPTYDVANFGHDTSLPLNCISGNVATITPSTSTFVQVLEDGRVPIDEVDLFITDSDKMALIHPGDDTDFDTSWEWAPDMSAQAYTLTFNFADKPDSKNTVEFIEFIFLFVLKNMFDLVDLILPKRNSK